MALPKQKARRSTGGRAPRKINNRENVQQFRDHKGQIYTVVGGRPTWCPNAQVIRKLGVHLYCLDHPQPSPKDLAASFLSSGAFGDRHCPRIDVYTGLNSIEECIEHHRREKVFRRKAVEELRHNATRGMDPETAYDVLTTQIRGKEPLPHIVPTWCDSLRFWREHNYYQDRYRSWILVAPKGCKTWSDALDKGITLVQFDLDWAIDMETLTCDEDPASDSLMPGDKQPWIIIEKVEKPPSVVTKLLCVRSPPNRDFAGCNFNKADGTFDFDAYVDFRDGWKTPGNQGTLSDTWSHIGLALYDCTYSNLSCPGCDDDEPHDDCEWEVDEHYFDDDGQCVACRRKREYRRRSKRIASGRVRAKS